MHETLINQKKTLAFNQPASAGLFIVSLLVLCVSFSIGWTRPSPADYLVEARESYYNSIFIYSRDGLTRMAFGHNSRRFTEAVFNPAKPDTLVLGYTRFMTLPIAYTRSLSSILEIGVGGGRTLSYLHKHIPGIRVVGVELDNAVIDLARKYFELPSAESFNVVSDDGRRFLMQAESSFDVVLIDAYRGPFVPFHLTTKEFYELAKRRLAPGGAVAQNISTQTMLYDSAIATLKSVFDHVDLYRANANVVAIAYDGEVRTQESLRSRAQDLQSAHAFVHSLPEMIAGRQQAAPSSVRPLTDDFAPVEALHAISRHNQRDPLSGTSGSSVR